MTVYTKTIVAALAVSLGVAPLVGTASAAPTNSNADVAFANQSGALEIDSASDLAFGTIDLSSTSEFHPVATNMDTGKLLLNNTLANPTGTYTITVEQTNDWVGGSGVSRYDLPVNYNGTSITSAQNFVNAAAVPVRGSAIEKNFNYDTKNFTLDLTGSGNLTNAVNNSLQSQLTWTLSHEPA